MGVTLVTGASGFVGRRLVERLAPTREVVCLSRKKVDAAGTWVAGSFDSFEDLRGLDRFRIEAAVHLAAVTGGCSEEDGLAVNVVGTRRLMRYLVDRGCGGFVLASSIAAVGALTPGEPRFVPLELPMRPAHPCVGRDAYGLSKAMMEDVARYFARVAPPPAPPPPPGVGIINLRLGAVTDEAAHEPAPVSGAELPPWGFVLLGRVALSDVVRGLETALDALATDGPGGGATLRGFHSFNLVGPDNCSDEPVPEMMHALFGASPPFDLSAYERPGHGHDPLWSMDEIRGLLSVEPRVPFRPSAFRAWQASRGAAVAGAAAGSGS